MGADPRRWRDGGRLTGRRSIILIGLPGAGKSTVAPQLARLLDTTWCDLDQRIAAAAHRTIAEIFRDEGETHFRQLERDMMRTVLAGASQVIAAGGGWAAEPGNLASTDGLALTIYLSVPPAEGARRLQGTSDRPMLEGGNTAARLQLLLAQREQWYQQAAVEIDTGQLSPEAVATAAANAARQLAGW